MKGVYQVAFQGSIKAVAKTKNGENSQGDRSMENRYKEVTKYCCVISVLYNPPILFFNFFSFSFFLMAEPMV